MINKTQKLYSNIKEIDKKILDLKNERYTLHEDYVKALFNDCQNNIKKCFKDNNQDDSIYYYMIIKTKDITYEPRFGHDFDQYNYYTLKFEYPFDGSLYPFKQDVINIDYNLKLNNIVEIDLVEFLEKFNNVNNDWIEKMKTLNKRKSL